MQARAVVFPRAGEVEFQSVRCPDPGPEDVVVEVTHSWISNGTEGSYLRGERVAGDQAKRSGDPEPFPVVAGYQKIGRVQHVGDRVTQFEAGETVFAASGRVKGMFHSMGGQISPSVSGTDQIWKLPDTPEPLAFAGLVLAQVGYNCGTRPSMVPGDVAYVIGDGMVGLWAAQTLALRGARVVLLGRHAERLALFDIGPHTWRLHARDGGFESQIEELQLPPGQVIVDTVGSVAQLRALQPLLARGGQIVSAGFYGTEDLWSLQELRNQELALHSVSGWTRPRMDETLKLIASGQLRTLPLITHHFPVREAAAAWDLIRTRSEPCLGVILDWTQDGHV